MCFGNYWGRMLNKDKVICNQSIITCIGCHNTDMVASAPEGCGLIIAENVKSDIVSGDSSF